MTQKSKFRISLSTEQISWILSHPDCPVELRKQLQVHLIKINSGLVTPAYEVKVFADLDPETQYRKISQKLEAGSPLTEEEKEALNKYRYTNDLMSDAERLSYEERSGLVW